MNNFAAQGLCSIQDQRGYSCLQLKDSWMNNFTAQGLLSIQNQRGYSCLQLKNSWMNNFAAQRIREVTHAYSWMNPKLSKFTSYS